MKSLFRIIIGRTIGFIIFLILLGLANLFSFSPLYTSIIHFFNNNLLLLFILFLLGMVNDIFWLFKYNIFAPLMSGVLSIFVITFIYRVLEFIGGYLNFSIDIPISIVYIVVFIIAVLAGYATIIARMVVTEKPVRKRKVDWQDVEDEFKYFFYNLGKELNRKSSKKSRNRPRKRK